MNTVLEIETYGDLLTEDQKQRVTKAKDEKNIQYRVAEGYREMGDLA